MAWMMRAPPPERGESPTDLTLARDGLIAVLGFVSQRAPTALRARIDGVMERVGRLPMPTGLLRELDGILSAMPDSGPRETVEAPAGLGREAATLARGLMQVAIAVSIRDGRVAAANQELMEGIPQSITVHDAKRLSRQAEQLLLLATPAQARAREEKEEMSRLIAELGVEIIRMGESGSVVGEQITRLAQELRDENLPDNLRAARTTLLQRVRVAASETERLREGLKAARKRTQNLETIVATQARELIDLQSRAAMDPLTQICNRGTYDRAIVEYVNRAHELGRPLSLVILDIDHFKVVNDTWGHPAGDEVLRRVAGSLAEHVREGDVIARLGGEELAVLLERANLKAAHSVADRMRMGIGALKVPILGEDGTLRTTVAVTVSAGVAQLLAREDWRSLYRRADRALYTAKQSGRDRVCSAP